MSHLRNDIEEFKKLISFTEEFFENSLSLSYTFKDNLEKFILRCKTEFTTLQKSYSELQSLLSSFFAYFEESDVTQEESFHLFSHFLNYFSKNRFQNVSF